MMASWSERRRAIMDLAEAGEIEAAVAALAAELATEPGPRAHALGAALADRLAGDGALRPIRVEVLRTFTVEPGVAALRSWALTHGLSARVALAGYDQLEQAIAARGGEDLDAIIIAARLGDLVPALARRFAALTTDEVADLVEHVAARVEGWLAGLRRRSPRARLVLCGFARPRSPAYGLADPIAPLGHRRVVDELNRRIAAACRELGDATFIDVDAVLFELGGAAALDARMEVLARQPLSAAGIDGFARHLARVLAAAFTPRRKCLVIDADNTLWGGILGEDGIGGIALGPEYPGRCHVELQEAILDLARRGVILAMASKNDEAAVLEVLENHPHQVLRAADFAARRINWNDKVASLRELAAELDIGLDSLVFIDDSDFECALVRDQLPEVEVHQVPGEPLALAPFVRSIASLDSLAVSEEDRRRGELYRNQASRERARQAATDLDSFFASLELRLAIEVTGPDAPGSVERAAQLSQRTNQLNLTTRRYSAAEIAAMVAAPDCDVFHVRLADRFGDYGVCGLAILGGAGGELAIDTLLLSCRVIGRGVEEAVLSFLERWSRRRGAAALAAEYRPSSRNELVADLFDRLGYRRTSESDEAVRYRLSLEGDLRPFPPWFKLHTPLDE
jgi:FkbH-like protein